MCIFSGNEIWHWKAHIFDGKITYNYIYIQLHLVESMF